MSTITRERAQEIFLGNGPEPTASEERELARMALASLTAEPVAMRWRYLPDGIHGMGEWNYRNQAYIDPLNAHHLSRQKELLFTAPPAPVSVPDFKKLARELVENLVDCGGTDDSATKQYLKWTEKTCRAAMLKTNK